MNILIIGATRGIGKYLTIQALSKNYNVLALARRKGLEEIKDRKLKVIQGNILDKNDLQNVIENIDCVCLTIGARPTFKKVKLFSEGTVNIIKEMKEAGCRRLLCATGIGAGDSKGHGGFLYDKIINPLLLKTIYQDKDRQEEIIKSSGLEWTIVRPAMLTYGKQTENYKTITDLTGVTAKKISRADVADFMLKEIEQKNFLHQTPLITY